MPRSPSQPTSFVKLHLFKTPAVAYPCFCLFQPPVQIKEFGAVTHIDISSVAPYNYAVTASTRVSLVYVSLT